MSNAIESLAYAVVSAVSKDLNPNVMPIYDFRRNAKTGLTEKIDTGKTKDVRPYEDHCQIYHFPQMWGSTALGFGGIGGASMTTAYTTVVIGPNGDACVYFAGRLAYRVNKPSDEFYLDVSKHRMRACPGSKAYQRTENGTAD